MYKLKLKNTQEFALVDDKVYEWLSTDPEMIKLDVLNYLYLHTTPRAVFNRRISLDGKPSKILKFYLHNLIAENFLNSTKTKKKSKVGAINGNLLDCRLENLRYQLPGVAYLTSETKNATGYKGVYQVGTRYRAVITINGKLQHIGYYNTARQAAVAYNQKVKKIFGNEGLLNIIPPKDSENKNSE
ncbi:MAG: hypothetical protein GC192_24705 [Bacteroidetes bacterium]|nr:hypothetical protein [Bacteroidota bacterium]